MALQEVTSAFIRRLRSSPRPACPAWTPSCRPYASAVEPETHELEVSSHESTAAEAALEKVSQYDPSKHPSRRSKNLPPSRYQFRPPRYYRGPLHPHQPPKESDIASREFFAGPFSLPRLEQTYQTTFAPDLMTLFYQHFPPGYEAPKKGERLRQWVGDSPYFKNRPLRGPRGGDVLLPLRKPITHKNIPKLEGVTVHTMVKGAIEDSAHIHVAGMILQAITSIRATTHATKKSVAGFGFRQGQYLSATCELRGENMYHFLSKLIDVVLPKIKDWRGVKGTSGDSAGNIAFGLQGDQVALFPEVEVNYDSYPPKMIPGMHIIIKTSAKTDYDARMLLQSIGIPFYGKMVD
ncbi:54S ribosomal L7, mitochondrial [Lecanosticta acicola]|uniref:Large ribosomal subunit protein uL5m n=1 Tax=Lecanosticta acicola TaxID=111012 RepID=A0AAI8YW67_9PEZI|nr:54S ribosomal L7, mitochondrial [Lecanosticta acicola]